MDNQRTHPRIEKSADVTVTVQSAPGIAALEGKNFQCQTADISFSGIRLQTDVFVSVGSFLELSVILPPASQTYWHTGEVIWSKETNRKGQYQAGILFSSTKNPQMDSWRPTVAQLLGEG